MPLNAQIENSNLSQEDKDLWFSILEGLETEQLKVLADFINDKEENLKELTDNLKAKRKAFEKLDKKTLEEILETEK